MFTRKIQTQIFDSITRQSANVIQKELNERGKKLEDTYKSIRYNVSEYLIEDAKVEVDNQMRLNVNITLNKNIDFRDIEKQNIPLVLERGGALQVKNGPPAQVGGHFIKRTMSVKI